VTSPIEAAGIFRALPSQSVAICSAWSSCSIVFARLTALLVCKT
jgi:hypothetical protein